MRNLEQKIKVVTNKTIKDYEVGDATPTDVIPYIMQPEYSRGLINVFSAPLTRRERRALKRKEKKQKDVSSSYICVNKKTYNMLKEKGLIKQ